MDLIIFPLLEMQHKTQTAEPWSRKDRGRGAEVPLLQLLPGWPLWSHYPFLFLVHVWVEARAMGHLSSNYEQSQQL